MIAVCQSVLLGRGDPRHVRMTVEVAAAYKHPKYALTPLGDLLAEPIAYGTSRALSAEGESAVLRMNNLTFAGWDVSDLKYLDATPELIRSLDLRDGDLLVNRSNGSLSQVGKAAVFNLTGSFLFASFLLRLRVDRDRVLPDFVAQFLNSPAGRLQVERLARPILMSNISPIELASVMVPLPLLEAQATLLAPLRTALDERNRKTSEAIQMLVGVNDDVDRLVGAVPIATATSTVFASTGRNLRAMDRMGAQFFHPERADVLRAVLNMRATVPARLDALVDFVEERGVPVEGETVFGLSAVEPNTGEILPATDDPAAGRRFRAGDLLFSRLRPYLNKVALMTHPGLCSPEFYVLRPKGGIDPGYLAVILRSPLVLHQVNHMSTGNTHPRVAEEDAKAIVVPVAVLPVQQEVAAAMAARRAVAVAAREDGQRNWEAALTAFGASLLG